MEAHGELKRSIIEDSGEENEEYGYDVVVVGSGYGGSVAACRIASAGAKVCLLEKGKRWEAQDFPTNSYEILSTLRMESSKLGGVSFGPKDALFQVYEQGDSLAAVACGLGGGSLVNAGVMLPCPPRVRHGQRWPKEWERDWDLCEASAAAMLNIQSIPAKFPNSKIMKQIITRDIEDGFESSLRLSMNFGPESSSRMGSCLACGNCFSGCPYNAKSSTDKNYIENAIQAGCVVITNCCVECVVRNQGQKCTEERLARSERRWRVYLNEIDYIVADFVVLSAGVFGTTEILFKSKLRGLQLSEFLGRAVSCNGNNVAYLAGSPAPLKATGLDKSQLSKTTFQERPGPSISSSFTSSRGFTIQSAIVPVAYPSIIFKGITTYGWPNSYWFLHGIIDKLRQMRDSKGSEEMVLNVMGYDNSDGEITYDSCKNKLFFSPPTDPLLSEKTMAFQRISRKLGGVLFMSRYRSTSVHLLGGCNSSSDPSHGVCNPKGQVFDPRTPGAAHPGLYACDASLIPCVIGINPSLTIATIAEHVSRHLVPDVLEYKNRRGATFDVNVVNGGSNSGKVKSVKCDQALVVMFEETMRGHIGGMPCTAYLKMRLISKNEEDAKSKDKNIGESNFQLRGKVGGCVEFKAISNDKLYVLDGIVDLCSINNRTPYTQHMRYQLLLASSSGSRYVLEGEKTLSPYLIGLYAWKETTTLDVIFRQITDDLSIKEAVDLKGQLKISAMDLLKSLRSMEGKGRGHFVCLFLQSIFRTYISQVPRGSPEVTMPQAPFECKYPESVFHEMKTEDGISISCRQWKSNKSPVLLLNGYSQEGYWLPTEPNDLVRTILKEGHEPWLLQPRSHPSNPSNNFTIDDIARFDIPAVVHKILEMHGPNTRIHVVAHCLGGLAIHMALAGGHVSSQHIASLTCTNTSMFFKINALSKLKMWLPLIPISMVILGKNKILPLLDSSKTNTRQKLLKSIARFIPRYERCTCNECEIFSGIFGNSFWHENISPTLHHWLNKQNTTCLPMSAFPHLRKICMSGHIVDSNGEDSYLIHPERMAVSTVYISGARSLLVTPETSFLANKYMKLHQPSFRHERVVVEGFGHSDLLIGEESYRKVFPHIVSHIKLAEEGKNNNSEDEVYSKEALDWSEDPIIISEGGGFEIWFSPSVMLVIIFLFIVVFFTHVFELIFVYHFFI